MSEDEKRKKEIKPFEYGNGKKSLYEVETIRLRESSPPLLVIRETPANQGAKFTDPKNFMLRDGIAQKEAEGLRASEKVGPNKEEKIEPKDIRILQQRQDKQLESVQFGRLKWDPTTKSCPMSEVKRGEPISEQKLEEGLKKRENELAQKEQKAIQKEQPSKINTSKQVVDAERKQQQQVQQKKKDQDIDR
jgi:hypothetical protein